MTDLVHESDVNKDRKFIVFESQLMQLFQRCHSCGLEEEFRGVPTAGTPHTVFESTLIIILGAGTEFK